MAKKNSDAIDAFKPERILASSIGKSRYSQADIAAIVRACPAGSLDGKVEIFLPAWWRGDRPETISVSRDLALVEQLNIAAAIYLRDAMWETKPRPAELKDRLGKIKRAAARLLKTLGLGTKSRSSPSLIPHAIRSRLGVHAGPGKSGSEQVRSAAATVKQLHDWADRELGMMKYRPRAPLVYSGDAAFNKLLHAIAALWRDFLGGTPQVSFLGETSKKRRGKPCGPFFTFVNACLGPLGLPNRLTKDSSLGARLDNLFSPKRARKNNPKAVLTTG